MSLIHVTHNVTHHVTHRVSHHVTHRVTYRVTHHVTYRITHHVTHHVTYRVTHHVTCSSHSLSTPLTTFIITLESDCTNQINHFLQLLVSSYST